jgi:hypothetical protein
VRIEVKKPTDEELKKLKVTSWPIWECGASEFEWFYDAKEICYFPKGKVTVKTDDQEVSIQKGDLAVFPKGLKCVWKVAEAVQKHYKFE